MKKIILIIAALTLTGCHFGSAPVVVHKASPVKTVVVSEPVYTNTVIVEEVHYCSGYHGEMPYYEEPSQCYYYHTHTECDWYVGWGCYEVWTWDEYTCEWYYSFDYCI